MLTGHIRRRWLTSRIVTTMTVLVFAVPFVVFVDFLIIPAGLAIVTFAYLVAAVWRWHHRSEGFEVTSLGVRSALVDLLEPTELARDDITCLEIAAGGERITVRAGQKALTLNWRLVELDNGEQLTAVEAVLRMSSILGVPAFTIHDHHEPTPLRSPGDAYDAPVAVTWRDVGRELRPFRRRVLRPAPPRS